MTPSDTPILDPERRAGVSLHLTALPGAHGIGDIGDAALAFIDRLEAMEISVWQFLPTGPTGYGDSPYQPFSAFAGNEMLIGLDPLVRRGLLTADEAGSLADLPRDHVDYGALIPRKAALLERAADRLMARDEGELKTGLEEFLHRHDAKWLHDYALFRILKTRHGERPWTEWAQPLVRREADALRRAAEESAHDLRRIKVLQYLFDRQWRQLHHRAREAGITLFADIPIYIALDSSDAWADREILQVDRDGRPAAVAGVPPDYFSADGQLWGNPLYDWAHHARTGYAWWIDRLAHAAAMSDLVRIDHFRGFEAYWAVPAGETTARNGEWRPGPGDALFDAISDALGHLPIVAEDLGVITPAVDALRLNHAIPGMKVLQFEIDDPEFDPAAVEENCVCYTGTHDNDTTLGWFRGTGEDTRTPEEVLASQRRALELTGGSPQTIHHDVIRLAFSTPALLAVAPMQDFLGLGSEARVNIPGTTRDNWRWRVTEAQLSPAFCDQVAALVRAGRRSPRDPATPAARVEVSG